MEKKPKEKKFKQNAYEEIRQLVEDSEGNNIVKEIQNKNNIIKKFHIIFKFCNVNKILTL